MQQLTLRQRRLLYLHYWHDVPVAQLASAWGVSQQAIRQALQRAHRSLYRLLAADTPPQGAPVPKVDSAPLPNGRALRQAPRQTALSF